METSDHARQNANLRCTLGQWSGRRPGGTKLIFDVALEAARRMPAADAAWVEACLQSGMLAAVGTTIPNRSAMAAKLLA